MDFVTGGTGLLGSHVLLALTGRHRPIRAIYRDYERVKHIHQLFLLIDPLHGEQRWNLIEWVKGDILDIQSSDYNEELDTILYEGDNVTYRATYLIDEEGTVFHESVNHMPLGRNVKEYIRLIDAFTHVQEKGEVCPANWEEGKDAMNANRDGVAEYLKSH